MYLFFLLNDYTGRRGTGTNKDHNVLVCLAVCCGGGVGGEGRKHNSHNAHLYQEGYDN